MRLHILMTRNNDRYVTDNNDPVPIANSQRFLGLIGVMTLVLVWPLFFILNSVPGLDTMAMPTESWEWEYVTPMTHRRHSPMTRLLRFSCHLEDTDGVPQTPSVSSRFGSKLPHLC